MNLARIRIALAVVFALAAASIAGAAGRDKTLPVPAKSGIRHIVVVMMENRSFDHILGWLPGADGRQATAYPDKNGNMQSTYPLAPDYQGCSYADPDHSYDGGRTQFDGGLCDGWLRAGTDDLFPVGYYVQSDLAFLGRAAGDWTVLDRYFAPIMAPTYPNRIYQHAAVTDRLDDSVYPLSTLPTIWDRLAEEGYAGRYYASDIPFLGLWGTKYAAITRTYDDFLADCAAGTLPDVAFVDPPFLGESEGLPPTITRTATSARESRFWTARTRRSSRVPNGRRRFSSSTSMNGAASSTTFRRRRPTTWIPPSLSGDSAFPRS